MQEWLNYFEHNRVHRLFIPWEEGANIEAHLRRPLIRSLRRFQVGESGEGRKLRRHAAQTGDPVYARAIELFVREEQEHARLMGELLRRLGAPLLRRHWSSDCFKWMRRACGLRVELLVLLLPEMIAKCYFRVLHDATRYSVPRAIFAQILHDENGHVAFHVEYLRRAFEGLSFTRRIAIQVAWRLVYRATCAVMIADHGPVLRACGMSLKRFWNDCGRVFDETAAGIFSPATVLAPAPILQLVKS